MGLVQQGWVGQSRGKMPLPRFYWQPWERLLWEASVGAASRRDSFPNRAWKALPRGATLDPKEPLHKPGETP